MTRRLMPAAAVLTALALGACGGSRHEATVVTVAPLDGADITGAVPVTDGPGTGATDDTGTDAQGGGGGAGSIIARAARRTTESAQSYRMQATVGMSGMPGTSGDVYLPMTGQFDAGSGRSSFTMDLSAMAPLAGSGASALGPVTMIMDPAGSVYMQMDALAASAGAPAGSWIRIDTSQVASGDVMGAGFDPRGYLALLTGEDGSAVDQGREDLRGVSTTHYAGQVDMAAALAQADAAGREELTSSLAAQGMDIDDLTGMEIPLEVWIDDDGLLRKLSLSMDASQLGGSAPDVTVSVQMEFFDYGADISVPLPPPTQIVTLGG